MPISARLDDILITEPPPERINAGMPWRQPRKVPKRSSLMTRQNSSTGASTTVLSCGVEPPALLCRTSRRPNWSNVARIAVRTLDSSVTSVRIAIAPLPAMCAVSSPAAMAMSATTTRAPSRANRTAVARPIPDAAPVMNATLPSRRAISPELSSDQFAHPRRRLDGAAEAVEVHADDVARLAREAVAGERDQLLARIGLGDEPGDAAAEAAQRAKG